MSMTKEQITAILAELDADLRKGAQEAEAVLRKAAEEDPESESVESKGGEDSNAPAMEGSSPEAPPEGADMPPAGPEGASPEGAPPAGPEGSQGGDPAADGGLTPEALQAEYAQLPPEELEMHIQAALAAKEALAGASAGGPPSPDAGAAMPPAGAEGASPAGAPPMPPAMGKNAMAINAKETGGKISKSETDLAALVKSQQEDIENLTKAMSTLLEAPVRKSVAALSDVAPVKKSENSSMTRKEVDQFIKENAPRMTKSERDLWLQFVDNKVPASKLAPMLERLSSK